MVAGTQKVMFLCNCCSTTLVPSLNNQSCCSGTTDRAKRAEWRQNHCHGGSSVAVVAEWRHSGRHSDRSMDAIGRPKEAQWWYKEGRSIAQIDTQCLHFLLGDQWPTTVHPLCDQGDVCAFTLPPLSYLWATDFIGDLCATVLNMLKTPRRPCMAMSERPMCHPWTTKAIVRPPFCLQRWPGQFCGRTREAQRSQPLCKGGISEQPAGRSRVCLGSPAHIYRNDAVINKIYLHLPLDKMTAISHTIFHGGTTEEGNCSYLLPRAAATGSKRHKYGPNTQSSRGWNHVIFGV